MSARRGRGDRGTVTVWSLGLVMILGFFGWMTLDLWGAFAERRELAAAADQAAQAGAAALDTDAWRSSGVRQLDPTRAEQLAVHSLDQQNLGPLANVTINATTEQVTVVLEADVRSGLVSIFNVGGDDLRVTVTAIGIPREDTP